MLNVASSKYNLDILYRDNLQEEIACKTTAAVSVSRCAYSCPDMSKLPRGVFNWSGGGMAILEVDQNERSIEF